MEPELQYNIMLEFLKALSNVNRLKLAGALANHSQSLDELANKLNIHPKEVLHHLDQLIKLELVTLQDIPIGLILPPWKLSPVRYWQTNVQLLNPRTSKVMLTTARY